MRRTRKILATGLAAASLAISAGVTAASAANGSTTVTLASVDTLTILTTPAAVLSTTGSVASGDLGVTTVVDPTGQNRTVSVSSTGFTAVGASGATIAGTKISACVNGGPTSVTGGATFTGTVACTAAAPLVGVTTPTATLFSVTGSSLLTQFTFTPKISVDVSGSTAAIYTGTVTQTVV